LLVRSLLTSIRPYVPLASSSMPSLMRLTPVVQLPAWTSSRLTLTYQMSQAW
jgi:hypothetical protein